MDIKKIEKKDLSWDPSLSYAISETIYRLSDNTKVSSKEPYPITIANRDDFIRKVMEIGQSNENSKFLAESLKEPYYTVKSIIIL